MAMRLTDIGSTYLWTMVDSDQQYFDGAKTYKVTLPKGIPAANANADGSTTVYFAPKQPKGVKRGNWIQTIQRG